MMADNTDVSFHPDGEDHAIYMNAPTCLPYNPPPSESNSALYEFIGRMMLPATITSSDIIIGEVIGSGHFGEVHKAVWRKDGGHVHVAVKMQNDGVEEKDKITFLREAAIMGQFDHNHVVKLFGVVSESSANGLWDTIVMELLPNGSLHSYLPNALYGVTQETAASTLLGFSRDVASGMEYLSSKKFIHRDLAARNVLLDAHLACKIADFGMAHDIDDSYYYKSKGGLVPLKWTAPEALAYRKYSTSSDVWSYGCVLYEIWSLGKKPLDNLNVHEIFYQLIIGYRQPPPPGCPRAIYQLMIKSWNPTPGERPTFASIHRTLVQPKEIVLKWSFKDHNIEKDAVTLGASLESGKLLYTELQNKYFVDDEQSSP
jgi:ephrin-B